MPEANGTADALTGTVKGPGELPHEYLFITADNLRARIGEFVYYVARNGARAADVPQTHQRAAALRCRNDRQLLLWRGLARTRPATIGD